MDFKELLRNKPAWPEVALKFCPRLILFKNQNWTGRCDRGSSHCHIICISSDANEWEEAFFLPIAFRFLCCETRR